MTTATTGTGAEACQGVFMDHYRQRKYRGPETWARVREAYVAGEAAPSVARRFDVGLANLRKKAMREGWTRASVAKAMDRALPPRRDPAPDAAGGPAAPPAGAGSLVDDLPGVSAIRAAIGSRNVTVLEALSFAAARAASLLAEGRAAEANVQITAIGNLAKVTGMTADDRHHAQLRHLLLSLDDVEPPPPRPTKREAHFAAIMAKLDATEPNRGA